MALPFLLVIGTLHAFFSFPPDSCLHAVQRGQIEGLVMNAPRMHEVYAEPTAQLCDAITSPICGNSISHSFAFFNFSVPR